MEYPDWNWTFHGEVVENGGGAAEIIMKLTRCLSRDPQCPFKQQQVRPWWLEPAEWLDPMHRIVRIPRADKCDYMLTECIPCRFFRRLWERRSEPWYRALKSRIGKPMTTRTRQLRAPPAHARSSCTAGGQQQTIIGCPAVEERICHQQQ